MLTSLRRRAWLSRAALASLFGLGTALTVQLFDVASAPAALPITKKKSADGDPGAASGPLGTAMGNAGLGQGPAKDAPPPKPFTFEGPLAPLKLALRAGRYAEVVTPGRTLASKEKDKALREQAEELVAEALLRTGQLGEAERFLVAATGRDDKALGTRAQLATVYQRRGERERERPLWQRTIDEYEANVLDDKDPRALRYLALSCRSLSRFKDANETLRDAANLAKEKKLDEEYVKAHLAWAELFLEKYNPASADESVQAALAVDPENPAAHVLAAQVAIERGNHVADAEEHLEKVFKLNPRDPGAVALRAEILIDNEQYEEALAVVEPFLEKTDKTDLVVHSLRAAALLLLDRPSDYEAERKRIAAQHPTYTAFHRLVAERLTVQHRYDEAVALLEQAVALDGRDFYALGALGSGYLRLGQDEKGLEALRRAWRGDRYNARTRNLLELFEKDLPKAYSVLTVDIDPGKPGSGGLRLRIPNKERELLLPLLVPMVQKEWKELSTRYQFQPKRPLTIELFSDPSDYAVRTVGLPGLAALGVTFGQVVTGRSPAQGDFNWGLMIWHELSHVFAIQLSKSRVPRWFTEGLSEWETTKLHPQWVRRTHAELYAALRAGTLLSIADLNVGFTRARDVAHIVVAYHEAACAVDFLVRKLGFPKIVEALRLFGQGMRTREVLTKISGQSIDDLDRLFRADLEQQLAAYKGTVFVRPSDYSDLDALEKASKQKPGDARLHALLAIGLIRSGAAAQAAGRIQAELAEAQRLDARCGEALLAEGELALKQGKMAEAEARFRALIASGGDGFDVRQRLGDLYIDQGQPDKAIVELERAKKLDPDRAEPFERLAALYEKRGQPQLALKELQGAALLDIMDAELQNKLVEKLHAARLFGQVVEAGEQARYLSPYAWELREKIGEALLELKKKAEARIELEAALKALPEEQDGVEGVKSPELAARRHKLQALYERAGGVLPKKPAGPEMPAAARTK